WSHLTRRAELAQPPLASTTNAHSHGKARHRMAFLHLPPSNAQPLLSSSGPGVYAGADEVSMSTVFCCPASRLTIGSVLAADLRNAPSPDVKGMVEHDVGLRSDGNPDADGARGRRSDRRF